MEDKLKSKHLYEIHANELFKAQTALEDELIESLHSKFLAIDGKSNVEFEYARVRGALEALKGLKAKRDLLIEDARSRVRNS